jgi:hypothetical protein
MENMSYKIGQFKRTDLQPEAYGSSSEQVEFMEFISPYSETGSELKDGALKIKNKIFQANTIYIVDFTITKNDDAFDYIKMKLKKNNTTSDYQSVKLFNLKNKQSITNIVGFQAYTNYDALVLEAVRNSNTLGDTKVIFNNAQLKSLNNILNIDTFKNKKIVKIGIQGPEGLQFVVNGELMRLGKSGMYVSHEDMTIQSLGFVLGEENKATYGTSDGYPFFAIDYIYEEVASNE